MARFEKGPDYRETFGKNEWLGSTEGIKHESWTVAASTVPTETIDDATDQKILRPGTIMAEITSGADIGKVGPFQDTATDGRQTAANIRGINNTFLPWQLMERDVDIDVVVEAFGNADKILGYDDTDALVSLTALDADSGVTIALTDFQTPKMNIRFRKAAVVDTGTDVLGTDFGSWPV
jgi:hypothetical protein